MKIVDSLPTPFHHRRRGEWEDDLEADRHAKRCAGRFREVSAALLRLRRAGHAGGLGEDHREHDAAAECRGTEEAEEGDVELHARRAGAVAPYTKVYGREARCRGSRRPAG
jgi:hypothetical protein